MIDQGAEDAAEYARYRLLGQLAQAVLERLEIQIKLPPGRKGRPRAADYIRRVAAIPKEALCEYGEQAVRNIAKMLMLPMPKSRTIPLQEVVETIVIFFSPDSV